MLTRSFRAVCGVIQKNFEKFLVTIKYVLTSNYVGERDILEGECGGYEEVFEESGLHGLKICHRLVEVRTTG